MSFKRQRVIKYTKLDVFNSTHLRERSTRISTSMCKDFLSQSKVTMFVLEQQLSLSFTRNKDKSPRIELTTMSWTYYMEHLL